jgi:hypothetical protein
MDLLEILLAAILCTAAIGMATLFFMLALVLLWPLFIVIIPISIIIYLCKILNSNKGKSK